MNGISIVVATYNRVDYSRKCLESLTKQEYEQYEIIVVNDCSSDNTSDYLDRLTESKINILHNRENLGPSDTRNRGVEEAQYKYVAFIDDDCTADKDWLKNLEKEFNQGVDFVVGQVYYIKEGYRGYFPERLVRNAGAQWPMGCNLAFRKDVFKKLRGFNKEFDQYHNEDTELALRAISEKYKYARALNAVVHHQAMDWTVASLLNSARNASVWPHLKKIYPKNYLHFAPPVRAGLFIEVKDYFYILLLPILVPVLLIRYLVHGKRDLKIFFTKWPVHLLLKRYYIYREAVRNRELMF